MWPVVAHRDFFGRAHVLFVSITQANRFQPKSLSRKFSTADLQRVLNGGMVFRMSVNREDVFLSFCKNSVDGSVPSSSSPGMSIMKAYRVGEP